MPEATVTVLLADLETMMAFLAAGKWNRVDDPGIATAWKRLTEAKEAAMGLAEPEAPEPAEPPLPPGIYARVELPGWRNHTGWVTAETRFGATAAVVRDWDGREVAVVYPGPACQVLPLPTPLRRPEPELAALPAGQRADGGYAMDEDHDGEPADAFAGRVDPEVAF